MKYAAKKIVWMLLTMVIVSFLAFAAFDVISGDPATAMLGTLGPVVGWVAFNGLALIIANAWGFLDGEWKGFAKARKVALYGNAVIIAALVVVGISNGL